MRHSDLAKLLTDTVRAGAAPGAGLALSCNGEKLEAWAGNASSVGETPLSTASRFQLGCITKLLTAVVALEMAGVRRLDLDEPIANYLPELEAVEFARSATARHLLSHTSGYQGVNIADPAVRHFYGWPKFLAQLRQGVQLFPVGSVFNYEHTECVLLGEITQRVAERPLSELYRSLIFEPLGIECGDLRSDAADSTRGVLDHGFDPGSGRYLPLRTMPYSQFWHPSLSDLTMTLADLVKLGEAVAGIGSHGVLKAETVGMLRSPQVHLPTVIGGKQHERIPIAFGHGCAQYGEHVFGHNGSARGQTCALRFDVSSGLVLAVGLNCWRPNVRDRLCAKVIAAFGGNKVSPPPRAPPPEPPFAEMAGHYIGPAGTGLDVSTDDTKLQICMRASSPQSTIQVALHRGPGGGLELSSELPHLTVGFVSAVSPTASWTGLMVGLNAYRRETVTVG